MRINWKKAISYGLFDFASSAHAAMLFTFAFPIFFKEVIAPEGLGDFYWGLIVSISVLVAGLLSPAIGAMADHDGKRKRKFLWTTALAIIGTALLYFAGAGMFFYASLFFVISNIGYNLAVTLYDAFLPDIAHKKHMGQVSGFAWGLGYMGGVAIMLLLRPLYMNGFDTPSFPLVFPLTALFFLVFSLPIFWVIPKEKGKPSNVKEGFFRLLKTFRELRKYKQFAWFLLAVYLMKDALTTFFAFGLLIGRETYGLSVADVAVVGIAMQVLAFPSAWLIGGISDKIGYKKSQLFTVVLWILSALFIGLGPTAICFFIGAGLAAMSVGASQSVARSWMVRLVPKKKRFEFFGFNGFASRVASTTGPVLFGILATAFNQRVAIVAFIPFLIISFIIFWRIKE